MSANKCADNASSVALCVPKLMSSVEVNTFTLNQGADTTGRQRIPWYLWCAAAAVTSVTVGVNWDISWHRSIGRDSFWTPAHIAIYLCGVLAGIACGYLILRTTFTKDAELNRSAIHVLGFSGPLGAFLAAWGGITMLTSAPFDNWWHSSYGLDIKILSPPHAVLILGIYGIEIGSLLLTIAAMNRANIQGKNPRPLEILFFYLAGLMLVHAMFFRPEYASQLYLHQASAYIWVSWDVPLYFAVLWKVSRNRWASTWMATVYSASMIALILILPMFHAEPKLGPVYQSVTHFIPPAFPLLLVVPAIGLDLLWKRIGERDSFLVAALSGPIFVISLVAVEWPFASFLLSKASQNRFFGTGYLDYATPSWSEEALRQFVDPQHGFALCSGLARAMVYAAVSVWLGLKLGDWMRRIQR